MEEEIFRPNGRSYIYILANTKYGLTYIGMTGDLIGKIYSHRKDVSRKISNRYKIHNLVYYETAKDMTEALKRKKCLKNLSRKEKMELIDAKNPEWQDLYYKIIL
ncbi:MAG: GIY-YIG nuclease family protein [Candidatus Eremiobacterota bacterium]